MLLLPHTHTLFELVMGRHRYMSHPLFCRVSKQPLLHVHPSTSPSNPFFSSAIVFDADTDGGDPAQSSMIIGLHDNGPPDISPINIGCGGVGGGSHDVLSVRSVEGEGVRVSCEEELSLLSVETKEKKGVGDDGREQPVENVPNQQKFPSTPSKDVHMQVSNLIEK